MAERMTIDRDAREGDTAVAPPAAAMPRPRRSWRLAGGWLDSPIVRKEARSRMRNARTPWLVFAVVLASVALAVWVLTYAWPFEESPAPSRFSELAEASKTVLTILLILQGFFCLGIIPGIAGGAIAGERERGALDLLFLTRLSTAHLVIGKVLASVGFLLLLQLCTLPPASLVFLLGGVSPGQLLWCEGLLLALALTLGALGVYCSTWFSKTVNAMVASYIACLLWAGFMPLVVLLHGMLNYVIDTDGYVLGILTLFGLAAAFLPLRLLVYGAAGLLARAQRRPPSRAFRALTWCIMLLCLLALAAMLPMVTGTVIAAFTDESPGYLFDTNPEFWLVGNALFGILNQMDGWEMLWWNWYSPPWLVRYFTPIALGVQVLGAGVFLLLAVRRVRRLRVTAR